MCVGGDRDISYEALRIFSMQFLRYSFRPLKSCPEYLVNTCTSQHI